MAQVMLANLATIVGEPVGKLLGLRQQKQARIFVGVAGEQYCISWLEHHLIANEILHSRHAAIGIVDDLQHARMSDHFQQA